MGETWWVGRNQLDEDQRKVISLPVDDNVLVTGPPGSGKTNLMLLRANYLYLAGLNNIAIVCYTNALKQFLCSGANRYDFPVSKIFTLRGWQNDLLKQYQYDHRLSLSGDFDEDRGSYYRAISSLNREVQLEQIYEAILLDEAQDYVPEEIDIFAKLTKRLFCVADKRQKIYKGNDSISTIIRYTGEANELRYHYRNGLKICRLADGVAQKWHGYQPMTESCNYDESSSPSSVDVERCPSLEKQIKKIITRLGTQRTAFPDEFIGIIVPKVESMNMVWNAIQATEHAEAALLLHGRMDESFVGGKQIIVTTFHGAKGLEFRALHLAGCDELKSFGANRQITFTAITRAKTALSIYHCDDLHGYFESAITSLNPISRSPSIDEAFGVSE